MNVITNLRKMYYWKQGRLTRETSGATAPDLIPYLPISHVNCLEASQPKINEQFFGMSLSSVLPEPSRFFRNYIALALILGDL